MISFTIQDIGTYQAEEGMTWQNWVGSSYNVDGFTVYNRYILTSSGVVKANRIEVSPEDVVVANFVYTVSAAGGGAD